MLTFIVLVALGFAGGVACTVAVLLSASAGGVEERTSEAERDYRRRFYAALYAKSSRVSGDLKSTSTSVD